MSIEIKARLRRISTAADMSLTKLIDGYAECVRIWGEGCAVRQLELYEREFGIA